LENTLPVAKEDDDLMEVKILAPVGLQGTVRLKISNPHSSIRLWTTRKKDALVNIPAGGKEYATADLPQTIFVEGIALGRAVMTLEYIGNTTILPDTLNIDVVSLSATQTYVNDKTLVVTSSRVIYDYNRDIRFTVQQGVGTPSPSPYTYLWDLDGNTKFNEGIWEVGNIGNNVGTADVCYGPSPTGQKNIFLPKNFDNRRIVYQTSVMLTDGKKLNGFKISKAFRVALDRFNIKIPPAADSFQGTAVSATESGRRLEIAGLIKTLPTGFEANTPPNPDPYSQEWFEINFKLDKDPTKTIDNGNRLQYSPITTVPMDGNWGNTNPNNQSAVLGLVPFLGHGTNRKIYVAMVSQLAYDCGLKKEDLLAVAEHEYQHIRQHVLVKQVGSVWWSLDDYWLRLNTPFYCLDIMEADSHLISLKSNGCWTFISMNLYDFCRYYKDSCAEFGFINDFNVECKTKILLQQIYDDLPFSEMKNPGYDYYVRPPK
jgi:hypothetical protein